VFSPSKTSDIKRVVFCSGKIYFDIEAKLEKGLQKDDVLVVRLEELAPFPIKTIEKLLKEKVKNINATFHYA
jgi:2-oxoglutarate dehydrogenase E1 component